MFFTRNTLVVCLVVGGGIALELFIHYQPFHEKPLIRTVMVEDGRPIAADVYLDGTLSGKSPLKYASVRGTYPAVDVIPPLGFAQQTFGFDAKTGDLLFLMKKVPQQYRVIIRSPGIDRSLFGVESIGPYSGNGGCGGVICSVTLPGPGPYVARRSLCGEKLSCPKFETKEFLVEEGVWEVVLKW